MSKQYIKDLPKEQNLRGVKVKTSSGQVGYWYSQWQKGVWLKSDMSKGAVTPVFVEDLKECFNWEVVPEVKNKKQ